LRAKLAAEPVFAVISGLAGRTWAPVHRFCQAAKLPCLLPNVELPVVSEGDFYPVYFSRGVLLEVDLMAGFLTRPTAEGGARPAARRVVQVFRQDDIGLAAAHALEVAAKSAGMVVENRTLPVGSEDRIEVTNSVLGLKPEDSLVLWLRPPDLAMLPPALPVVSSVLVSGTLGGLEQAPLTALWRSHVHMAYPFDLPEGRKVRMNFPLAWFKIKQLEVVSERVQTDTYIACGILAETLTDMLDSFVPDYLVERVEGMLSHRLVNGYYPHLSLAPGQRFASKGGYIVRFAATEGMALVQAGEWTTP